MEIEKLNLYRDTNWNDIKLRFCGHSECLPLHSYGPGTRPYYLMHFVLSGKGRLVVNKTEYQITELSTEVFEEIKDLLDILISIKNNNTKNDLYTNGILLLLLSKVGTFIEDSKELPERKSRQNSESHVQRAISIVEDFYGRDLTVQYIADKLGLNRSYLSEIFSKQMGVPLKKYILDFRITQSEEFLFTSDWSVDYISQICGFNSPSYFSKIFKEYHGISPTEYRKSRHKREHQTVLVK